MAASSCTWIVSVIILLTSDAGASGRAVDSFRFPFQPPGARDGPFGEVLRTAGVRRWRRAMAAEARRESCAELRAAWLENTRPAPERGGTVLQLRVRSVSPGASRGLVFPGKPLFGFMRRVYRCYPEGAACRRVKGIQSRLRGAAGVEFVLTREVLAMTASRAELHLQLSNPQRLDIIPVIPFMAKRNLPTRYSVASRGDTVELRVDLLFLLRLLQEAAGDGGRGLVNTQLGRLLPREDEKTSLGIVQGADGEAWHDRNGIILARDVGLVLGCSRATSGVHCDCGGVQLSDAPFMAVYYT